MVCDMVVVLCVVEGMTVVLSGVVLWCVMGGMLAVLVVMLQYKMREPKDSTENIKALIVLLPERKHIVTKSIFMVLN